MNPPICRRCDEPCTMIYDNTGRRHRFSSQAFPREFIEDLEVVWLCADCVDEVAEAMA